MRETWLGFEILRPGFAAALAVAPLALLLAWYGFALRSRARAALVDAGLEGTTFRGFSRNRARLRVACGVLAVLFASFALLGPARGFTLRDVQRRGLDIVVCVDTSRSMLAQDVKPDRLTRAQREVVGLLGELQGDRAALLAFAGDVRDVAPLTHDRATLEVFVKTLSPDENLKGGTDIGAALERALQLFDGRTGAHEAIVVITDGEDLEARGLEVAKRAGERGIRVYVVGMGTTGGGKIPDRNGFVRDEEGKEVVTKLSDTTLRAIADATYGAYVSVESSPTPLEEIYAKRIRGLEARELVAGKERVPHDRFQWPLVLAAVLLVVEAGLRERRLGTQGLS